MFDSFDSSTWLWLSIPAYIFMRAFEVEFASSRERRWYRIAVRIIAGLTLVIAGVSIIFTLGDGLFEKKAPPATPAAEVQFEEVEQPQDAEQPPVAVTDKPSREHVIEPGEDLYTVAMMYGFTVKDLKAVNGLSDTVVAPGTRIRIPATQVDEQEQEEQ